MQVLPRFYSTDGQGNDEQEFLRDFFDDPYEMMSKVFLKGYQWPFDVRKAAGGSSIIDILVYIERCKGRRIFLDYRENPCGGQVDFGRLEPEAREYLNRAGACFGTPIERLKHMNLPAVEFYRERGVDLESQPLEIALCAQHNNGGLSIDAWWQTNVEGFFAVGEVSASHGVYRPGGSALNAGQVGAARAAQYIAVRRTETVGENGAFEAAASQALVWARELAGRVLAGEAVGTGRMSAHGCWDQAAPRTSVRELWDQAATRMSRFGAAIRRADQVGTALRETERVLGQFEHLAEAEGPGDLWRVFRLRDILISQQVYLSAMLDYIGHGGKSRGSALYTNLSGKKPDERLPEEFAFCLDDGGLEKMVQEAAFKEGRTEFCWREVRPIPQDDDFFENVWRGYRENGNVW